MGAQETFFLKSGTHAFQASNVVKAPDLQHLAYCRCANCEGTKGISVCKSGWGTPKKVCSALAEALAPAELGCRTGVTCKKSNCDCTCKPTVDSNKMTFEQCKTECANVDMALPFNDASRKASVNTGCYHNHHPIWINPE